MHNKKSPLSIGLIVDGEISSKYVYELAEWGQRQSEINISHLIIQENKKIIAGNIEKALKVIKERRILDFLKHLSFSLICRVEMSFLKKEKIHKRYSEEFNISKIVKQTVIITPLISESGFVYRYSAEDIDKIKSLNLDLLIRFSSGILKGGVLNASKLGIISFHHGDNKINRGGPPGFWEVYYKKDATGFVIQKLTEELDGGDVLISGEFQTKHYYLLNRAFLYEKSFYYMRFLLSNVAKTGILPPAKESSPYFNRLFKMPNLKEQLVYILKLSYYKIYSIIFYSLLRKSYRWNVAFARSGWKDLVMWRSIKIKNPKNHFLADPFVINENGRDYCFVEDYDYDKKRGHISVYELKSKNAERLGDAIVEPFHLSFPYLFRFEGKLYMCPETAEMKEIRLYECVNFPLQWKLSKVIMENVSAADTMIFEMNNVWWLFTNIDPANIGDHCSELFIFYADSPLSSKWISHTKNPIYVNAGKARNAGLLFHKDLIYRVAQKQGFNLYGNGFSINKISILNKENYIEDELCAVEPNFLPNLQATHHLHSNGDVTVFDYTVLTEYKESQL